MTHYQRESWHPVHRRNLPITPSLCVPQIGIQLRRSNMIPRDALDRRGTGKLHDHGKFLSQMVMDALDAQGSAQRRHVKDRPPERHRIRPQSQIAEHVLAAIDAAIDNDRYPVNRRGSMTPATTNRSTPYDADQRPDPTPFHNLSPIQPPRRDFAPYVAATRRAMEVVRPMK